MSPRVLAMAAAVVMGAGIALATVTIGKTNAAAGTGQADHDRPARGGDQAAAPTTTTPPPPPDPVLPFNAKIVSHDIPVAGGGVRSGGCSGSLIAPQWIITAGHCFHDINDVRISGQPTHVVTVTVGKLKDSDPGGHTADVIDVRQSPKNDIALAKLATPVEGITPLALADTPPTIGQQLGFAGWGSRSPTVKLPSDQLKRGQFAIMAIKSTALEADSTVPRTVDNSPCPDDSGAPYFVSTDDRTGTLVAVESTGPPCPQAGRETISRVDVIADWIRLQITQ
jgi:secreted trypsin-like serine protease